MEKTYTYTRSISIYEIYETDCPNIPMGYEKTGEFRPPKKEELYIQDDGSLGKAYVDFVNEAPRLILRKKKIKRIIYTQVRTGTPQPGEFYQSCNQDGTQMFRCVQSDNGYMATQYPNVPIFKREEEEV